MVPQNDLIILQERKRKILIYLIKEKKTYKAILNDLLMHLES